MEELATIGQTIGQSVPRTGIDPRIVGATRYTADLKRPGMLHARVLRSPHPHARITAIDTARALAMPGVHAVLTHLDAPAQRIDGDLAVLDAHLRFVGDEVAVVATESPLQAEDALAAIAVTYALLPPVYDADAALTPDAPPIHPRGNLVDGAPLLVERGDVTAAMAKAARVFQGTFFTQEHAPVGMETRAALAEWSGDTLTVWKTSRSLHAHDRPMLATVCGIPEANVRVICTAMGGGFGNKDEGRIAALAALLARKAGRPVRLEYDRAGEFLGGRNRQASSNRLRIGVTADGTPMAIDLRSVMNAGSYVASGRNVVRRIGQGALYLYRCANARFEGLAAYTNRPSGGSFRGLGAPLGHFALEVLMDQIAAELQIDPLEYRLRHHVPLQGQPGRRTTPVGQVIPDEPVEGGVPFSSNGLRACIEQGAERIGWRARRVPNGSATGEKRRGIGMALGIYKGGVGREAQADLHLTPDGRLQVHVGVVDVGQGSTTILAQVAAETLRIPVDRVDVILADTGTTPPGHITAGSSTTFSSGGAVKLATEQLRNRLLEHAAALLGESAVEQQGERFVTRGDGRSITLAEVVRQLPEPLAEHVTLHAGSAGHVVNSFAAHFAEVEVELDSGRIRVLRYVAAHDSGRIVNPRLAEGQVTGGVLQFLAIALREELLLDPASGVTLNPSFLEHKCTGLVDFPPVEVIFAGEPDPLGPFGAKALGEPPVVPVFAAISNAVANATGVWLHETPFTARRVLEALRAARVGGE